MLLSLRAITLRRRDPGVASVSANYSQGALRACTRDTLETRITP